MRNFGLGTAAVLAVVLAACQEGRLPPPVTSVADEVAPAVTAKRVVAVYEGVLPCAECRGIRTELTLFDDDSTYKLVEVYLGTPDGDRTFQSDGTWTLRRSSFKDPKAAAIYELRPRQSGEERKYLIVDERQIRQLDRDGREIASRLDYTLRRKDSTAAN